jgi:hypothetical protein
VAVADEEIATGGGRRSTPLTVGVRFTPLSTSSKLPVAALKVAFTTTTLAAPAACVSRRCCP